MMKNKETFSTSSTNRRRKGEQKKNMREVPDFYNPDREAEEPYRREKEWQRWKIL